MAKEGLLLHFTINKTMPIDGGRWTVNGLPRNFGGGGPKPRPKKINGLCLSGVHWGFGFPLG